MAAVRGIQNILEVDAGLDYILHSNKACKVFFEIKKE